MTNERGRLEELLLKPASGFGVLFLALGLIVVSAIVCVAGGVSMNANGFSGLWLTLIILAGGYVCLVFPILLAGLKVIHPNDAAVYTLFGRYYGTIASSGFYFVNPFVVMKNPTLKTPTGGEGKVSLKATTLNNERQKINDSEGNPIDIGVVVIWRVTNATKAVFEVDNYKQYLSTQCDAAIRNIARQYPYDVSEGGDEKSLRASSQEIADELRKELQNRVSFAGLEIIETRIAHLAYAQEIAAAMLQRQQAGAIIAARQKIVDGAVGMVEIALNKLSENKIVELDDERKAAMVSNLLVVLCGNRDVQPIVNSGSIY